MQHRNLDMVHGFHVVAGNAGSEAAVMVLEAGSLLLIERGEAHEIRNTGGVPLETLNVYVPPEYRYG